MDHRKFMLEKIARNIKLDKTFDADLNVCRPFTLTVNSAYESSGKVHSIGNHHIREIGSGKDLQTIIKGVDDAIEKAHQNGLLLSETSVTWAVDTETFETEGYVRFPLSGELRNIMSNEEVMQGCR
jgi:hypothetical protein